MLLRTLAEKFSRSEEFSELNAALKKKQLPVYIEGIAPSSIALIISSLFKISNRQIVVITENSLKMQELSLDISCFLDDNSILTLPSWDTLPYEFVSASEKTEKERITSLYKILSGQPYVIITTVESYIRYLPSKDFLMKRGQVLNIGEEYPLDAIIEMCVEYGYTREMRVEAYGHFSVKGGILDIFLPSHENPVRLDFFGDTLESIRTFDMTTQVSSDKLETVTIYPRKELVLLQSEKKKLLEKLKKSAAEKMDLPDAIIEQIGSGVITDIPGIEDIFHLAIKPASLSSYFNDDSITVLCEPIQLRTKQKTIEKIFSELYERKKKTTLCLLPGELINPVEYETAESRSINLQVFTSNAGAINWQLRSIPNFHGKISDVRKYISEKIESGWKIFFSTGFEGQARRLFDLFSELNPSSSFENPNPENNLNIVITPYSEGLEIIKEKLILLTDHEIFGKSYRKRKSFKSRKSRPIESFLDLKTGDYIVHINHGIGVFRGIERMTAAGIERDFLLSEYADGDKLYVPLDQINLIQKYIGLEGKAPRIDVLGKKSAWNRIKDKVRESVEEIARELVEIYSRRAALKGYQFPPDTLWQEEFESLFEYEETPDQITAIEDVKDDMENVKPMDRLVCGDVGFGKTEVAIRAAFKAVMAGRQAAILVPTTVLCMQHFRTFTRRFENYPIKIEMISRFRTQSEVTKIKSDLAEGSIDIIIGTHAILSKDIKIKNLGLLIIDEEQKFGVKHKEQLKKFRTLIDVLTLTATPIPRTLHMSLAGIRDLTIISTPPENRQAIDTYVMEENPDILRSAILAEIERDGQAFYIHNRVQNIEAQAEMLRKLVPEATFCTAHGQLEEDHLEDIIIDFMNKKYDILVCTTIIESGVDIPNVNTIIINRADTFGLSQLYQLKGRVGRSTRKAYAYLFYPKHTALTEEAQKRLQVISEYSELGSGFKIAMKDLEIRGSGNIIGKEQSGNIMEVGFDLYTQMLEDAVRKLKGEKPSSLFRTPVFIKTDFYIPDEYISDERQKIEFYKRFESCESEEEVLNLKAEMQDRFGNSPPIVDILIDLEIIRAIASSKFIEEILEDSSKIKITLSKNSIIDIQKILTEIKNNRRLVIDPRNSSILLLTPSENSTEKKLSELKKLLQQIS